MAQYDNAIGTYIPDDDKPASGYTETDLIVTICYDKDYGLIDYDAYNRGGEPNIDFIEYLELDCSLFTTTVFTVVDGDEIRVEITNKDIFSSSVITQIIKAVDWWVSAQEGE